MLTLQNGYADRGILKWATVAFQTLGADYVKQHHLTYSVENLTDALAVLYFGPGVAGALKLFDSKRGEFAAAVLMANSGWGRGLTYDKPSQDMADLAQSIVKAIEKNDSTWFWKEEGMQVALFGTPQTVRHIFAKALLDVLKGESDLAVLDHLKNQLVKC